MSLRDGPAAPWLVASLLLASSPAASTGTAPTVVETHPPTGAVDVDPDVAEIRVVFDRDMATDSYSLVGGGPTFPETTGPPSWVDRRTFVVPVRLEPGREYVFSINGERHRGFRSVEGTPAEPWPVTFRTSGIAAEGSVREVESGTAFATLRQCVEQRYSYRDRLGLDWDHLFEEHRPELEASRTPREFAEGAAALLRSARDVHISLTVGQEVVPTFQRKVPLNFDLTGIRGAVPELEQVSRAVYSGRFPDGTGYLLLGSLDRDRVEIEKVLGVLERFRTAPSLILDLRANGGGDESLAREIAGCFVDSTIVYARHVLRQADSPTGYTEPFDRVLSPAAEGRPRLRGRVAVLQGRYTLSSAEAFVLMMRRVPGCISLGDTTYGGSGNPRPCDLGNGVTVHLPSWKAMDASGRELEGKGIAPDVVVDAEPEAFRTGDPVIARARELLTAR